MPEVYLPSIFLNSKQKGRSDRSIEVNLDRGLFFPEAERAYCQVGQAALPYSFINISQDLYENAAFDLTQINPANPPTRFVLPEGCYTSLTELEAAFNKAINPAINPDDPQISCRGNTVTNQVEMFNIIPGRNLILLGNLATDLGFPPNTVIPSSPGPIDNPAEPRTISTLPVLFLDIVASGILVLCEGDLQVGSFFQELDNSNVLAQIPIINSDVPGGMIVYPRDVIPINLGLTSLKTVRKFKILFRSPRLPDRDLVFLQGDTSLVLNFFCVY